MPSPLFVERFRTSVHTRPDSPAVIWHGRTCSYGELGDLARRAHAMLDKTPPGPVTVPARKSSEALALLIGCWMADRTVLLPSPELGDQLLRELSLRAGCGCVLTPTANSDGAVTLATEPLPPARETESKRPWADDTRLLLTTSGSTGTPKVVPLSATGVDAFHDWTHEQFGIAPGATVLSYAPLNFDLSLLDVWSTLAAGATTVLIDPAQATNGAHLREVISSSAATVIQAVPMFFRLLTEAVGDEDVDFPAVENVIVTGDALPASLLKELPRLFPRARVFNLYGCTETNDSVMHEVRSFELPAGRKLPIGRPLPGVRTLLVDDAGAVIEGAGSGQLLVSTPFQADGYLDPALTRERFVGDPTGATDEIYYRTGDIVRRDAGGLLSLEGRDDFHVKVRGVRTNMGEVEHVLTQHPNVREAVVIAVPDERAGHRLHAVIRPVSGSARSRLTSLMVRQHCAERLPRTAIPSTIQIVDRPLPKTSTGKIDRKAVTVEDKEKLSVTH